MNVIAFLQGSAPSGTTIGAIVAIAFLVLFLGAAFVAYKALKRTVKMAVRLAIVGVILVIAVAGSISLWYFSSGGTQKMKPPAANRAR
jgi:riboflavin transporter FmnP